MGLIVFCTQHIFTLRRWRTSNQHILPKDVLRIKRDSGTRRTSLPSVSACANVATLHFVSFLVFFSSVFSYSLNECRSATIAHCSWQRKRRNHPVALRDAQCCDKLSVWFWRVSRLPGECFWKQNKTLPHRHLANSRTKWWCATPHSNERRCGSSPWSSRVSCRATSAIYADMPSNMLTSLFC